MFLTDHLRKPLSRSKIRDLERNISYVNASIKRGKFHSFFLFLAYEKKRKKLTELKAHLTFFSFLSCLVDATVVVYNALFYSTVTDNIPLRSTVLRLKAVGQMVRSSFHILKQTSISSKSNDGIDCSQVSQHFRCKVKIWSRNVITWTSRFVAFFIEFLLKQMQPSL